MHKTAEYGIAAHWKYKENLSGTARDKEEEKLSWLRQILEWQRDTEDNKEFMSAVKTDLDLFAEQVYCFTPNGDVKNLPAGSTPIDFAYSIHSAVGNKMVGARVNGRQVPVTYQLNNGDRVEIVTSQNSKGPSRDWLNIVRSTKGYNYATYSKPELLKAVMTKYNFKDWDSVLAAIGHGALKEGQVMNKLIDVYNKEEKAKLTEEDLLEQLNHSADLHRINKSKGGITVKGVDDVAVHFSKCCSPVPGDEIVGYVTRGRGISIHRTDCINIVGMGDVDRSRLIDAEWQADAAENPAATYSSEIRIFAADRTGMLFDISKVFTEANINVTAVNSKSNNKSERATFTVAFDIKTVDQLNHVIAKLRMVPGVLDVERSVG